MSIKNAKKKEIRRIVLISVQNFIRQHPEAFNKSYVGSIAKRVAGDLYTHFEYNPIHHGGKE